jgi:transposase
VQNTIFVGLDVHKAAISVAIARNERDGEVRHWGTIPNRTDHIRKLAGKLAGERRHLRFCYEAGPCGYGLHRHLTELGPDCVVVAPSLIPVKAGDRVKTGRRDAMMLAKLHRAGELTTVWVPDAAHEAMRDLVRARRWRCVSRARRANISTAFCSAMAGFYPGKKGWTKAYRRWLTTVRFEHPAQQIVLQDYIHARNAVDRQDPRARGAERHRGRVPRRDRHEREGRRGRERQPVDRPERGRAGRADRPPG